MARPHVPQFGDWDSGNNVPYTVYFDKARQGRGAGKMINPNDPQENPELFGMMAPQAQPQPKQPEVIVARGQVRPNNDRRTSREYGDFKQPAQSPARNENVGWKSPHGGSRGANSARPVKQSMGSEHSFDQSPSHPHYQAKVAAKKGSSSPSWDGSNSYGKSHGTPDRSRLKPANRVPGNPDRAAAIPIFGDWDEKNPSSGDGYTEIFNKAREDRNSGSAKSPNRINEPSKDQKYNGDDTKIVDLTLSPPPQETACKCTICMGEIIDATATKCGHVFCKECLETVLQALRKCPICRKRALLKDNIRIYLPATD